MVYPNVYKIFTARDRPGSLEILPTKGANQIKERSWLPKAIRDFHVAMIRSQSDENQLYRSASLPLSKKDCFAGNFAELECEISALVKSDHAKGSLFITQRIFRACDVRFISSGPSKVCERFRSETHKHLRRLDFFDRCMRFAKRLETKRSELESRSLFQNRTGGGREWDRPMKLPGSRRWPFCENEWEESPALGAKSCRRCRSEFNNRPAITTRGKISKVRCGRSCSAWQSRTAMGKPLSHLVATTRKIEDLPLNGSDSETERTFERSCH
jgi:hypothetical protein